jgi:hypothetical protein
MAEKRMFAKTIIDSDAFLDMPLSAQALYFHLSMRADDEGFINNPKKIQRMIGSSDDDLKLLALKRFIIPFQSGVVVIKHWRIHNYIRADRMRPTAYQEERRMLTVKENGSYTLLDGGQLAGTCQSNVSQLTGKCQADDGQVTDNCPADDGIDKYSIDKIRLEESIYGSDEPAPTKTPKKKYGEYGWVKLSDAEYQRLVAEYGESTVKHYIQYIDESAQTTGNKNKWKDWNLVLRKAIKGQWGGPPRKEYEYLA